MQYLTFSLNGVEYAIDVTIVETVVEYAGATVVPSPLAYMKGVMDLRGQVIPVIDLRKKFGIAERGSDEGTSVIAIAVKGDAATTIIGALVDGVSEVVTIEEGDVEAAGSQGGVLWERYVKGIIRREGKMLVMISPEGMFSFEELSSLGAGLIEQP